MFDKGRKIRPQRRSQYDGMPDEGANSSFGNPVNPRYAPRNAPGEPDVDEYMMRSIMGMGGGSQSSGTKGSESSERVRDLGEEAGPDSIMLRIELPINRAEQLRTLARDLDESPQTLARLWIMERLRDLGSSRPRGNKSNGDSHNTDAPATTIPHLPAAVQPQQPAADAASMKRHLADAWISDPEERAVFDETYSFRQWGPYIAGLALAAKGRRVFTLEDMRTMLREELIPTLYNTPGALDDDLVIKDVEVGRPGDQIRPYACLQRVSPGVYTFLGFNRARAMRAAR